MRKLLTIFLLFSALVMGQTRKIDIDTQTKNSLPVSRLVEDVLLEAELDTEAELEAQITDMSNILQATEVDSESKIETLAGSINLIVDTEIDTEAELEAIVGVDFVKTGDSVGQLTDISLTSPADAALMVHDTGTSTWRDQVLSGDATMSDTGVVTIPSGSVLLDEVGDPSGNKVFSLGGSTLEFQSTAGAGGILYTLRGGGTARLFEVKQDTGNPGAGSELVRIEAEDPDILPLRVISDGDVASREIARFENNRATPTAGDEIFASWYLSDDGGTQTEFARLIVEATDVSASSEDTTIRWQLRQGGSLTEVFTVDSAGAITNATIAASALTGDPFDTIAPSTTKGDFLVHDGTDNVRLGVGANDTMLIADSAQTEGVKWGTPDAANITNAFDLAADNDVGAHYVEFDQLATPTTPGAGNVRLFFDSGTGKISALKDTGSTVSLEESGTGTPGGASGDVQTNDGSGGFFAESTFHWDSVNDRLQVGPSTADEDLHVSKATDGVDTLLLLENSESNAAASTNETAEIRWGFGGDNDVARLWVGKEADYTTGANSDSFMAFATDLNGTVSERVRIDSSGRLGVGTSSPTHDIHINSLVAEQLLESTGSATVNLKLYRNDGAGSSGSFLSVFDIGIGNDDGNNETQYVRFATKAADATDGAEDGELRFDMVNNGTVVNALEVKPSEGFNFSSSYPISLEESAVQPSNPSSSNQARIYVAGDNFVIMFNDGGTVRCKYLDMTGTGVTWTHVTGASCPGT